MSPKNQPYNTETITWESSVSGKKPGKQMVTASIYIRWLPEQASATEFNITQVNNNIARQVWVGQFDIEVKEPIIKIGAYTVGELWTLTGGCGMVGAVFGWIAGKYIPDRKRRRKE